MVRTAVEILLVILWIGAVWTCVYDWEDAIDRDGEKGNKLPKTFKGDP